MLTILRSIFISVAIIALLVVLLVASSSLRKAIVKGLKKLGCLIKNHLLATLLIIVAMIAIVMNSFTARLLAPFSELAIIVLGLCIMLGAIWKKSFKYAWKVGTVAAIIIFITVVLEKLPW